MKSYEGIFIIKPDLKEEDEKATINQISDEIKKNGGNVEDLQAWGKRSLSYKISKYKEGMYYFMQFKVEPGIIQGLKRTCKLNENILKLLITKRD